MMTTGLDICKAESLLFNHPLHSTPNFDSWSTPHIRLIKASEMHLNRNHLVSAIQNQAIATSVTTACYKKKRSVDS